MVEPASLVVRTALIAFFAWSERREGKYALGTLATAVTLLSAVLSAVAVLKYLRPRRSQAETAPKR